MGLSCRDYLRFLLELQRIVRVLELARFAEMHDISYILLSDGWAGIENFLFAVV